MMKRCPICALHIRRDSVRCPHCGSYLAKSFERLAPPDPNIIPHHFRPRSVNVEDHRLSKRRRRMHGITAFLGIIAVLAFVWTAGRTSRTLVALPIPTSFEEFIQTFGPSSSLTPEEKALEFEGYKGKYVRWKGTIVYLNLAEESESHISLCHNPEATAFTSDVTLYFRPDERDRIAKLRVGDRLTYVGMVVDYGEDAAPVVVQNGRIDGVE